MPSPLVYFQIATPDTEAARAFYSTLFDWKWGEPGGRSQSVDAQGPGDFDPKGSMLQLAEGAAPFVTPWFRVDDLVATVEQARALGARVLTPIRQGATGTHTGLVRGPDGQTRGIVQA